MRQVPFLIRIDIRGSVRRVQSSRPFWGRSAQLGPALRRRRYMNRRQFLGTAASGMAACLAGMPRLKADEVPKEYQATVAKGLDWVSKNQSRDGHWEANGGMYPSAMTGLGGMVLLMEGSTLREGKYADHIRRATDWLMDRSQRNGLLANPNI